MKVMDGSFFFIFVHFFFQAEDGRRYTSVTGVQTCALPSSCNPAMWRPEILQAVGAATRSGGAATTYAAARSEERRVGKECRSRRSPYH